MSWSASAHGTPAEVAASVQQQFDSYGPGPSKDEFAEALPHLLWLVGQVSAQHAVKLVASGSKSTADSSINVDLRTVYYGTAGHPQSQL